jgi:hypothetical protein
MNKVCRGCGGPIVFSTVLYIEAPIEYLHAVTKAAIRDSEFQIQGADWSHPRIYCKQCGVDPAYFGQIPRVAINE